MKRSFVQKLSILLTIIYLLFLVWAILFKFQLRVQDLPTFRSVNLIPFGDSAFVNGKLDTKEIISNAIIFVPFGLYLNILPFKFNFLQQLLVISGSSLLLETLQYIFSIGGTDITDLLMNTLGGIIGIILYTFLNKLSKNQQRLNSLLTILAGIATVGILSLSLLLMISN